MKLLLIGLLLIGCGNKKNQAVPTGDRLELLLNKKQTYEDEFKFYQDGDGWINSDQCDSALFSGLSAVFAPSVSLLSARDGAGKWYRRPAKDCYPGHSGSSISRDMLVGIMSGLYFTGDVISLSDIRRYGKANNWVMGSGSLDRTFFTPDFQDTLYRLTGRSYKGPPYPWIDPFKDHQRHVTALHIILRGEAQGKIDNPMLNLLTGFVNSDPQNALFQYGYHRFSDGDQSDTIAILSNEDLFPSDGPGGDRCRRWLWERHSSKWRDCPEVETNTGGDFLFMMFLLESSLNEVDEQEDSDRDTTSEHAEQTGSNLLLR